MMARGKTEKPTIKESIAQIRVKLLRQDLKRFNEALTTRLQADREHKDEIREMVGRSGVAAAGLIEAMVSGDFDYNHDLWGDCMGLVQQAIGKPPQALNLAGDLTHKVQRIVVEKPSAG